MQSFWIQIIIPCKNYDEMGGLILHFIFISNFHFNLKIAIFSKFPHEILN